MGKWKRSPICSYDLIFTIFLILSYYKLMPSVSDNLRINK